MSNTDIKEVVKEKYGQAALRVKSGGSRVLLRYELCCQQRRADAVIRSPPTCTIPHKLGRFPKRHFSPRWDAGTPRLWRSSIPARRYLILVPAVALMSCFLQSGWALQVKPMVST